MRGLERGIERVIRTQPITHVEIEAFVVENLVRQMEQGVLAPTPVWTNLKTFPWQQFHGKIHILTGGYPCQPFSTAGRQLGTTDPRHLWPYIEYGINTIRPVCCFFENVANHINIGYREVRESLQRLGYTVKEGIFSAQEVGAPHLRKRLFILAVANSYCTEQSKRRGDLAKMLGLQESQRQPEYGSVILGGNCETLDHPNGLGHWQPKHQIHAESSSQTMGDSEFSRLQGRNGIYKPTLSSESSKELDNSLKSRLEGFNRNVSGTSEGWQEQSRPITTTSLWPAGQGIYQHEWEEPRLESRIRYDVNGYNFTEDLLRMAGNAVVEQQAEFAFRTLLKYFGA